MNTTIKCACGASLHVKLRLSEKDVTLIVVLPCEVCMASTYHEGLVRGSHLKIPLPYDDKVGPQPEADEHDEEKFGPTGQFPNGKTWPGDQGELRFGIGIDEVHNIIVMDFGGPVCFIGMEPEQAITVGDDLINKANKLTERQNETKGRQTDRVSFRRTPE